MTDEREPDRDVGEQQRERTARARSRRDVLAGSAKLGGGVAALSLAGSGAGLAATGDDEAGSDDDLSDVDILNYALTLEQLEAALYEQGIDQFGEGEFERTEFARRFADSLRFSTYNYVELIGEHERTHAEQLTAVIEDLGGTPVSGLAFEFPYETADEFVALAQQVENLGVAAYAGVAPAIDDGGILSAALSIHSVEARHAGYLNTLNGDLPFPDAFDEPRSMDEVTEAVSPFIVEE